MELNKSCQVSDYGDPQKLCPDARLFNACVHGLETCVTKEQTQEMLERWNKLCEAHNCPYLESQEKIEVYKHYRQFYTEIPEAIFRKIFNTIWHKFKGKLDAISFDYYVDRIW